MNTKTKKRLSKKQNLIIIAIVLAVVIVAVAVAVPVLYTNGNFPAHPLKEAKEGQIKIACVGDSITFGATVKGWPDNSYPYVLNDLLGDGYCVNNYGYSGITAMFDGDHPYAEEKLYEKSLKFNPDIVVLMLGSNDSKPYNWKGADAFAHDLSKITESYERLESKPEIYIATPLPAYEVNGKEVVYDIREEVIRDEIRPAVMALAAQKGYHLIDMYETFTDKADLFTDGVHPTAEGARLFAETIRTEITK